MLSVLVVDDSEVFLRNTIEGLRRWGWTAEGAADGSEAIEILSSESRFDGVLLDRSMPGVSGDDVLRWIRVDALKDPRLRANMQNLCVVMLTGYGEVHNAVDALKLGAFQYLEKPIRKPAHLRSILAAGIALKRAHAMRRELLVTLDRHELFGRVRSVLVDCLRPEGVHIMFVDEDGNIEEIVGETERDQGRTTPPFVKRVMHGEQLVFEQSDSDVEPLGPILPDAKTLMAVPVPGATRSAVGVLDMESTDERAFDPCWSEVLSYLADLIGIAMEIEKRTAEREKLKQLGMLYREFRHSIATHAQIVSMQARELLETNAFASSNGESVRIRQRLTYIRDNADIIEGVVQDLKVMSLEPPKPDLTEVDVPSVIRDSLDTLRPRLAHDVELLLLDSPPVLRIRADRNNLAYCLKCLIENSAEAIEEARRTALEPREDQPDRIALRVTEDDESVRIVVLDSGVGFDLPADELFQPLYSTKTRRPIAEAQSDVTGAERVTRILELLSRWAPQQLDVEGLAGLGKGVDILIRDGDSLMVSVREGPAADDVTLGEFVGSSAQCIATPRPLGGDWPNRGVGLHSVRRIIEEMHGGRIVGSSEGLGKGATFTVTLPKVVESSFSS